MSIYDLITSAELAAYWDENTRNDEPYLGETLFPNRKQIGIDLKWIKGRSGIVPVLNPSAFDVHVLPRIREGFEEFRTSMPFFKESYYVDEELRQELLKIMSSSQTLLAETILARVFDDATKLLKAAASQRERLRMNMLTTGVVAFNANGQAFEFDYQLDPAQLQTAAVSWATTATSDPLADLQTAIDYLEANTDSEPARVLMNRTTFNNMKASEKLRNSIYALNSIITTGAVISNDTVSAYVEQNSGLEIIVYNKSYTNEQGVTSKYVPDGVVVVMPSGTLGNTWFGTTPEEADLMSSNVANVSIVDTGVAVTTMVKADPVSVETKVSQIVMPSFERAGEIVIIDVA